MLVRGRRRGVGAEANDVEAGMAEHAGDGGQVGAAARAVRADYVHHSRRRDHRQSMTPRPRRLR